MPYGFGMNGCSGWFVGQMYGECAAVMQNHGFRGLGGVHVVNCNSRGLGVVQHVEYVNAVWFRYELMFYVVFG